MELEPKARRLTTSGLVLAALGSLALAGCARSRPDENDIAPDIHPAPSAAPSPPEVVPSATTSAGAAAAEAAETWLWCPGRVLTSLVGAPRAGDPLRVLVDLPHEDTGNSHYAERVVLRAPGARPLTFQSLEPLVPIVTRKLRLSDGSHLLLGWTSEGFGEQSNHAWIVARQGGELRVASRLLLSDRRVRVFFALRRDGTRLSLGVPLPESGPHVHDEQRVEIDGKAIDERAVSARSVGPIGGGEHECYTPPFEQEMSSVSAAPLAWFDVSPSGFQRAGE